MGKVEQKAWRRRDNVLDLLFICGNRLKRRSESERRHCKERGGERVRETGKEEEGTLLSEEGCVLFPGFFGANQTLTGRVC